MILKKPDCILQSGFFLSSRAEYPDYPENPENPEPPGKLCHPADEPLSILPAQKG